MLHCVFQQRRRLEEGFDSDDSGPEIDEEQPQVVVLSSGDLTAAEADEEKKRIERGMHDIKYAKVF